MEDIKKFFNITKDKNESYQSFLTKLMTIWDESVYSFSPILRDKILKEKILDNVGNNVLRQQILAAKEVDLTKFLALCKSFDLKEDGLKCAKEVKAEREIKSASFFLPISEVVLNSMEVRFYKYYYYLIEKININNI